MDMDWAPTGILCQEWAEENDPNLGRTLEIPVWTGSMEGDLAHCSNEGPE